jgi:hypothetical protein
MPQVDVASLAQTVLPQQDAPVFFGGQGVDVALEAVTYIGARRRFKPKPFLLRMKVAPLSRSALPLSADSQ